MKNNPILLGVNVDHVATLRQVRKTKYPDPLEAVYAAENGGADGITVHLRQDRRHIQDHDVRMIKEVILTKLNLEMAVVDEMLRYAEEVLPAHCCLVPETREELTTEGGLDVASQMEKIHEACKGLKHKGIAVSLFIDPDIKQIEASLRCDVPAIEIHTGAYAEAESEANQEKELRRIIKAVQFAHQAGLIVNAGHGLHYENVKPIAAIPQINELNIGHAIVARAIFMGLEPAVREMKRLMTEARVF